MSLLEIENLSVAFGDTTVVDNVSFTVASGQTVGLVGESGSGKSVTSLAVLGLLTGAQVRGRISFAGNDIVRRLRGDRIAMIFQDPLSALNPYYQVGFQIVEAYRAHRKVSRRAARAHAVSMLDKVGIPDPDRRAHDYPHQFSGGMRQRVMIAMALCLEPELLIADEPTTALDVTVQAQILALLQDLRRDTGMALLLITHDLGVIAGMADQVVVMRQGAVVEHGDVEQIFYSPVSSYTKSLLDSVPRIDRHTEC